VLRHIALFRWKPEATAEDVSKIEAALHRLPGKIPCIQSYRFGRDPADLGAARGDPVRHRPFGLTQPAGVGGRRK